MPYKRRYKRRTRRRNSKPLRKLVNLALKRSKREIKHSYIDGNIVAISDSGWVFDELTPPVTQGETYGERIGARITPKKLTYKGYLKWDNASTATNTSVRIVIFRMKTGITPDESTIFEEDSFLSYFNARDGNFSIVKDYMFTLGDVGGMKLRQNFKCNIYPKKDMIYELNTAIQPSNYSYWVASMSTLVSTNSPPDLLGRINMAFYD